MVSLDDRPPLPRSLTIVVVLLRRHRPPPLQSSLRPPAPHPPPKKKKKKICDVALPETRDSAECRALLKGAGSSDLEVGRIRGASVSFSVWPSPLPPGALAPPSVPHTPNTPTPPLIDTAQFLLPAGAKEGKLVKLGGTGHGGMFNGAIAPADFTKPVGYTVRAFDGAAPLGERIALRVKDSSALGTSDNLAGGIVGLLTEQCGEIKVQPGSRVVCGICLLATDNIKSVSVSPDPSNAGVVSLPLADGDTQLGAIVSGAAGAARGAGALAAALAGLVVAAAAML